MNNKELTSKEKPSFLILEGRRSMGMSIVATELAFRFRTHFGQKVTPYPEVTFKPCYDSSDKEQFLKGVRTQGQRDRQ